MASSNDRPAAPPRVTLEIVGAPGAAVTIFRESPLDAPAPPIFEGEVPLSGRLRLRVPRWSLLIVVDGFGASTVHFGEDQSSLQVDMRPTGGGSA